jgi:hypothetical protein
MRSSDICSSPEVENLMKKLVEAEVDGQAIADKAVTFTDAIQRLREVSVDVDDCVLNL